MYVPPCLAIILVMQRGPRRQTSCLPASPRSTTRRSNSVLLSGSVASLAALIVDWKSASVSSHGIVESSSACTSTKRSREHVPGDVSSVRSVVNVELKDAFALCSLRQRQRMIMPLKQQRKCDGAEVLPPECIARHFPRLTSKMCQTIIRLPCVAHPATKPPLTRVRQL